MTKKNKTPLRKRIATWLSKPGMFSRFLVIGCLIYVVRTVEWAKEQFEAYNMEASTILTVTVGFFGTELALLCLKRVFAKKDDQDTAESSNHEAN